MIQESLTSQKFHCILCSSMVGFPYVEAEVEETPKKPLSEQPCISHPLVYQKQALAGAQQC